MERKIAVVGLGYVGLPVAVAFGRLAPVIGFDIQTQRVKELTEGFDRTRETSQKDLEQTDVCFTDNPARLKECNFIVIAVPTPIDEHKNPDLAPLKGASRTVGKNLSKGSIVVYESTVYPGATEEVCVAILEEESGLVFGKDFSVGYSPERINPGDKEHTLETLVKIVSGSDSQTLETVARTYEKIITAGVHQAPSIKVAEAAKVIENTQRDLNIALINELSMIFQRVGIDTSDVLAAASTKWNFLPFHPGLVGGHCIGVDPYYLTYKAEELHYHPQVILAGRRINDSVPMVIANRLVKEMIHQGDNVRGAVVTVMGITFKENVPDIRNSKVVDIVSELSSFGIDVQVYDPVADAEEVQHEYSLSLTSEENLLPADAIVFAVSHNELVEKGYSFLKEKLQGGSGVIFDVKSALSRKACPPDISLLRL